MRSLNFFVFWSSSVRFWSFVWMMYLEVQNVLLNRISVVYVTLKLGVAQFLRILSVLLMVLIEFSSIGFFTYVFGFWGRSPREGRVHCCPNFD